MSKREHFKTGNLLPPFSENLVFWAPLTDGDLTDHISGVTGYPLNAPSGNLTYDSSIGAYRFYVATEYQNGCVFPITNLQRRWDGSNDYTWSIDIRKNSTTVYQFGIGYSKTGDRGTFNHGYSMFHLNSYQTQISNYGFDKFSVICVYNDRVLYIYKNGIQIGTYNIPVNSLFLPVNWKSEYWNYITIAPCIGGNFMTDAYYKDARVYNRALTAQEVALL